MTAWVICWKRTDEMLPVLNAYAQNIVEKDAARRLRKPLGFWGYQSGQHGIPSLKFDPHWLTRLREGWTRAALERDKHMDFRATITAIQRLELSVPFGRLARCMDAMQIEKYHAFKLSTADVRSAMVCPECNGAEYFDEVKPKKWCTMCSGRGWLGNEPGEIAAIKLGANVRPIMVGITTRSVDWVDLLRAEDVKTRRARGET